MIEVLVIGTSGQLASALVQSATDQLRVRAFGRSQLDITKPNSIEEALQSEIPHVVINCAAYTMVDKAEEESEVAFGVNADGARHIARWCAERGIPLIHISTDYVFDGTKSGSYVETDITQPINIYGKSKLAGENFVRKENPQHIILRTSWVYSVTGSNFVKSMLRLAAQKDTLNIVSDQFGSPTYAPHLADAILQIVVFLKDKDMKVDADVWGTYHNCGQGATSWFGFASEIFVQSTRLGGPVCKVYPITTKEYPTAATRPKYSILDTGKLQERFGISQPDWQSGVAHCVGRLLADNHAKPALKEGTR